MLPVLRHRGFAFVWAAGFVSSLGDWLLLVALPLAVFDLTGSAMAAAGVFAADLLSRLVLSSVAGVVADRWDRRRTMISADLLQAVVLLPLVLVQSAEMVWLVYPVSAARVAVAQFFGPAQQSLIPRLVPKEELVSANAATSLSLNVSRLVGPAIGGLVAGMAGLGGVALLDSASFVCSALLVMQVRVPGDGLAVGTAERSAWQVLVGMPGDWWAGLRAVGSNRALVGVLGLTAAHGLGEGTISGLVVVWVREALQGGAPELGLMLSAQAVGGVTAGLFLARYGRRLNPVWMAGLGLLVMGLVDVAIWNVPSLPVTLVLFALVGVPFACVGPGELTLVQRGAPEGFLGRILGARMAVLALSTLVSLTVAGLLEPHVGVFPILTAGALCNVVGALWFLWLLRGYRGA